LETFLIFALLVQRARRRDAETTLAITNDRLRTAIDAGRFVGWDFNVKAGQNHWFGDLQGVFGIPSHTYSADIDEFRKRVHPEDRDAVVQAIEKAKETREPYVAEFRVNRNDGEVRWIIAQGKFHYSSNGIPERMLGLAVDITERKLAEDALASLSGQLIEAQEDERKRIARELHDDYNQRLAMMAIDLQRLAENIGDSSPDAAQQLYELFNRVSEVGADLHSLSHSLHSSTLESLGLVAGVKGFCKEFAEQQGIQVDFVHENIPRGIPGDAALCMFRIAQEALRNVKKHSGADKAGVRLEWLGGRLHLSVIDSGKGFDLTQPAADHGIGVHSMEERLRVLGGRLEIKSHPMRGTRVDAWLPFNVTSQHVS
jgi:signal transduction histidine kinase